MSIYIEKRKFPRANVALPLHYKELQRNIPSDRNVLTRNLSEGGARFNIDEFIPLQCRLVLEVYLPFTPKPIRAISKVVWIKKLPVRDEYEIGTQFLNMTKEDNEIISNYIKKIL